MKIRTQLIAGIVVFALLLAIISGFILVTNQQLDTLVRQEDLANSIALEVGELGYLSNDYILYREPRQEERWNTKYAAIAGEISRLSSDVPEQQAIASNLAANLKNTKSVFEDIAASPVTTGGSGTGFVQLSWSRMAVQNQGMIFDAGRLAHLIRDQAEGMRQTRLLLIFALMGTFVASLLTSYFDHDRRTLLSIDIIREGAQAVGAGDFSHAVVGNFDDEIGDLAHSFNRMVANLRTVTASKAELEQEVASRKRAEEDLVYANDRLIRSEQDLLQRNNDLNALNEELTATQEELQQNVDELTRAEVSLRQSEERFRVLLQHVRTVAVQGYAPDGTVTYWNEASERIYGYTEKEATGKNLADLIIPPEMRDEVRQAIARMAETGEPVPASELFLMRKDGSRVPVFSSHGVVRKSSGQTELFCIDIDLTERKRAEEALRKSEEEYRHVVEYAPASIYEISADGLRFNRVNDAMCRILGYTREELMAMSPFSILDEESRKRFRERIEKRSSGEDIDESVAYRVLAKDGRALWVTLNVNLNHGRGESTLVVAHDITERRQAEENLRVAHERFYTILSDMRYGILLVGNEDRVEFANQAFCDLFGLSELPADLPGLAAREIIGKICSTYRDPDMALARIGEILRHAQTVKGEEIEMSGGRSFLRDFVPLQMGGRPAGRLWTHIDITERKKAEEELKRFSLQRTLALDAANMGWWQYDPVTKISRYDERYREIFGVSGSEKSNEEILATRMHPDDLPGVWAKVEAALDPGNPQPYAAEYRIILPGDTIKWIEAHGIASFSGEGADRHATSLVGTVADITDRKKAEEALRETSQYLDNLINYANAPIIVWDPQIRITRFNHAFELLTGMAAGEAIGQHLSVIFPESFRDAAMDVVKRTMAGERLNVVELPILKKDGNVRVVLWNSATLYEHDGTTISSTIAQGQDITERKFTEEALRESEEKFRIIFETANEGIWITDADRKTILVNQRLADMLGYPADEIIGKTPSTFLTEGQEQLRQETGKELHNGTATHREFRFRRRDGSDLWTISSASPVFDRDGSYARTVSMLVDITKRRLAEEELKRKHNDLQAAFEEIASTQEELHQNIEELIRRENELMQSEAKLREALTEKEILLSEIHHRVKNNLAAFISLLSLDGTYEETESGRALRKDLQNRARSMALIHETLYRTGKFSTVDMEIYLTTLVDQIAATFRGNVAVHTIVDARGVVLDLARATTAGLIINELVTNSFKYAFPQSFDCMAARGEPCTVRVSFSEEDGTILLSVADNGRGLPPDLDPLSAKSLGLRLVNFLGRHQLRAEIAIRKEQGTEFIFRLNQTEDHP